MGNLTEKYLKTIVCFFCFFVCLGRQATAQDYHAVQGSPFAGSLGVSNNPASILSTPFSWDVTVFAAQLKTVSNAYTVHGYSLLSSAKNAEAVGNDGTYKRYADLNFNLNLLNARIALDRRQAIAFGVNLRGYGRAKSSLINYNDSLHDMNEFFRINNGNPAFEGNFSSSSWLEVFATYSRTLWEDARGRLNGGITVKGMRGISGAFAKLSNGTVQQPGAPPDTSYIISSGAAAYGYSYNYDNWKDSKSTGRNLNDFIGNSRGGGAVDLGFEYLVKPQGIKTVDDPDDYFDYDWKIGLSLLDWGYNQFKYGTRSRVIASPAAGITDAQLDQKFDSVSNIDALNDSVATIANGFKPLTGKFKVHNPTRLVLNVDRSLGNDFYVNADISVNLHHDLAGGKRYYTQSINFITLTPRWETKRWGVYFPMQYNIEKKFMIGGAFKAGPLLIGVHNWANVFSKNTIQNGGAYLALVIRAPNNTKAKSDKRLDCPAY